MIKPREASIVSLSEAAGVNERMSERQMKSDLTFGGKPLNPTLEIPCRDELKPYVRSAAIAAIKLTRYESADAVIYWLSKEHIDALREFPRVYPQHEAALVAEAVEVFLIVQLGSMYRLVAPDREVQAEDQARARRDRQD